MKKKIRTFRVMSNVLGNLLLMGTKREVRVLIARGSLPLFLRNQLLPKSSSLLITEFISAIVTARNNIRTIVLLAHLYMERMLELVLQKNIPKSEELKNFSFYQKILIASSLNLIDRRLKKSLMFVNTLRNKFVHNLDYDITDKDLKKQPPLDKMSQRFPYKQKLNKAKRNCWILTAEFINTATTLIEKHPYLQNIKR